MRRNEFLGNRFANRNAPNRNFPMERRVANKRVANKSLLEAIRAFNRSRLKPPVYIVRYNVDIIALKLHQGRVEPLLDEIQHGVSFREEGILSRAMGEKHDKAIRAIQIRSYRTVFVDANKRPSAEELWGLYTGEVVSPLPEPTVIRVKREQFSDIVLRDHRANTPVWV